MKTRDPFPVQGRIRQRYAPPILDPVEIELAKAEAREAEARRRVDEGKGLDADPTDLRGIPCIARGVGGTSPGSDPFREAAERERVRLLRAQKTMLSDAPCYPPRASGSPAR